ncbi:MULTISPECIES: flagellar hook-length control protein FliK [unclassified Brenneria]|uniref:flagellar hook-length control protein FliK n=1 Tax=unclassified Brenneria TaxID=2634434 RepID=UPI0029C552CA|nr:MULTISPECIES: flagellar hook-length control protein FliK [unclassified Brenneria]MDX5630718.1 flagellar hook-length control protein FliK [Brenneria sp. L3-3Z]MDX5694230.1 flagellar hook-length control protein FliK [Brenneria sp. L4-2C]
MKLSALPITTSAGDTGSSTASSLLTQGELPKDFIALLGKQLSLSSDPSVNKSLTAMDDKEALLNALGKDAVADLNSDDLNALLASFGSLTGSVAPADIEPTDATVKADKTALSDEKDSDSDNQAVVMQALLAMLPPGITAPANGADDAQNVAPALSGLITGKKQDAPLLSDARTTADDAGDENSSSTRIGIAGITLKDADATLTSSDSLKRSAAVDQADDSAKFATTSPLIASDRNSQDSPLISGSQSAPTPHISLTPPAQSTLAGSAATPSHQLATPFGSPQWQDALSQQVVMFSRNGQQNAELRLNPQELGPLHISLKIDDNQAQIHLASANSQVRSALEAALPHLRNAMAESGINLGQSSVGSDASSWQAQQQTANNSGEGNNGSSYQQQFGDSSGNIAKPLEVPAHLQSMASSANGVDIFA